jgi:hypothetical protein
MACQEPCGGRCRGEGSEERRELESLLVQYARQDPITVCHELACRLTVKQLQETVAHLMDIALPPAADDDVILVLSELEGE